MRILFLLILLGCHVQEIDTQQAIVETRGWPVVAVHLEGPGGDRTTTDFEMVTDSIFIPWSIEEQLLLIIWLAIPVLTYLYIKETGWLSVRKNQ